MRRLIHGSTFLRFDGRHGDAQRGLSDRLRNYLLLLYEH